MPRRYFRPGAPERVVGAKFRLLGNMADILVEGFAADAVYKYIRPSP